MNRRYAPAVSMFVLAALVFLGGYVRAAAEPSPQLAVEVPTESPLAQYLGFGYNADEEDAQYALEEGLRQDFIKECMNEAGFKYWQRSADMDSLEGEGQGRLDSNQEYRRSLSADAAKAYSLALSGRSVSDGMTEDEMKELDTNGDGRIDFEERSGLGCLGQAANQVPGVFRVVGLLREELRDLNAEIVSSPEAESADLAYTRCMNAAGVEGDNVDDVRSNLVDMVLIEEDESADLSETTKCDEALDAAIHPIRVEAEARFFLENRSVIEQHATKFSR